MTILADENIPLVDAFFGGFGSVRRLSGRNIKRADLGDAEILLVRSVTQVNEALLAGSNVRFVGTCTIGTDHLDTAYLDRAGIAWSNAPGCNARGVVDYVLSSLWTLAERTGRDPAKRRYGIVGAGQVGGRLVKVLRDLGWSVRVCDPLRAAQESGDFVSLSEIIAECDVISLHTPLTREGEHATYHLLGEDHLQALRPDTWLINASRGPVIDNAALTRVLSARDDLRAVLDVWEHEPSVNLALMERCDIATPHIAGYSLEGKMRGTAQIYQSVCQFLNVAPVVSLERLMPERLLQGIAFAAGSSIGQVLPTLCRAVYDPRRDDADLRRQLLRGDEDERRLAFDALRKAYPVRREIEGQPVTMSGYDPELKSALMALGVQLGA